MIAVLQAGLTVIAEQGQLVFGILTAIALAAILVQRSLSSNEAYDMGLSGWLVPFTLLAGVWLWLGLIPALLMLAAGLTLTLRFKHKPKPVPVHESASLLILVLVLLVIRLAFLKDLLLPSYFDSAQHYLLIRNLVEPSANLPVSAAYYHQGFHWDAALLVELLQANIGMTMLVFGQFLLAFMPVGVYGWVRQVTGSHSAGLLAFVLAGFGWYMPAHAANWGKYPAIASLSLLPFVLWLLHRAVSTKSRWMSAWAAVSVIVVALLHSRSVIALGLLIMAWMFVQGWRRLTWLWRVCLAGAVLGLLAWDVWYIEQQGILMLLLDPYIDDGLWITLGVLVLGIPAGRGHAQLALTFCLSIALWLGAVFVPVPVPGYGPLTLLDRPYVEMLLFLPLAVMGGLGTGELLKVLKQVGGGWRAAVFVAGLGVLVIWQALQSYNFFASACCMSADRDDLAAIAWLDEKLPQDAVVGVAASAMDVLPSEVFEGYSGSDAGIWILPLTGRRVVPILNTAALDDEAVVAGLCRAAVTHMYLGSNGQTFNPAGLQQYKLVFSVGRAVVYAMRACP